MGEAHWSGQLLEPSCWTPATGRSSRAAGGRLHRGVKVPRPRRDLRLSAVTLREGSSLCRGSRGQSQGTLLATSSCTCRAPPTSDHPSCAEESPRNGSAEHVLVAQMPALDVDLRLACSHYMVMHHNSSSCEQETMLNY